MNPAHIKQFDIEKSSKAEICRTPEGWKLDENMRILNKNDRMDLRNKQELIDEILSQPSAPHIVEEVHHALEAERKRREAFYNEVSEYEKAEFINGEVIIHSPVKKAHNDASKNLFKLIDTYVEQHDLGYVGIEKIMVSLTRNDYEPDICFFGTDKAAGFTENQSLFPVPDLAVEVLSPKTKHHDRGIKFEDYQTHGVQEYWLIDPLAQSIEQYRLDEQGQYELILKSTEGMIHCKPVRDFAIPISAIFDRADNLKELIRILGAN